ncbi:DUF2225 domain-containing protein [Bacillus sp. CGMCC 1.16607]|uniref:DUF2225 domain-containing protein n=1 Tax=Bacillus sp. CGMCC 1.16607 TaxID=3351842 RepID=UPI00362585BB
MTQISPLYDKTYECMACSKNFSTKKVRSRFIKVLEYDTDFFPSYHSEESNPIFYHINVCPNCGFSFSEDTNRYFRPNTLEMIKEKISNNWNSLDYGGVRTLIDAINCYKLAIYTATIKMEKHIVLAGMYLRVAWLYRSLKNEEQEQRFMKLSLQEYILSYSEDDFRGTQVSEVKLLYLIAELSIRTSDYNQAVKYFSKVIERQKISVEPRIIEMAKDRWQEIRETKKHA